MSRVPVVPLFEEKLYDKNENNFRKIKEDIRYKNKQKGTKSVRQGMFSKSIHS